MVFVGLCWPHGPAGSQSAHTEAVTEARPCLNLRPHPSTDEPAIRCLPPGQRITLLESRQDWGRVRLPEGDEGWVSLRFVEQVAAPADRDRLPVPIEQAEDGNRRLEDEIDSLRAEVARLSEELQAAADKARTAKASSTEAETESLRRMSELEDAVAAAATDRKTYEADREELEREVAALETAVKYERRRHEEEKEALEAQLAEASETVEQLEAEAASLRASGAAAESAEATAAHRLGSVDRSGALFRIRRRKCLSPPLLA